MAGQCCDETWRVSDRWVPVLATPVAATSDPTPAIDAEPGDWAAQSVLFEDQVGDSAVASPDLTAGRAFLGPDALYLLVEAVERDASFQQFEIEFEVGSWRLSINRAPGGEAGFLADVTEDWRGIGNTSFSTFSFGTALEGRID